MHCFALFVRPLWRLLTCLTLLAASGAALAGPPVVVGRVEVVDGMERGYELKDVYITSFADHTPITRFKVAFSTVSNAWVFVRSGTRAGGGCRTEVFRLVRLADNRLAIADPTDPLLAWGVKKIPSKMYPTFDCTSTDCMDCRAGVDISTLNLSQPKCVCADSGTCKTTKPGLGGPYGPGDVVIQAP